MDNKLYKQINKFFWPLLLTFLLSNSFAIIDTMMLSNYDSNTVSGVAGANMFQWIIGPVVFGVLSGIGIYGSQYFGNKDYKNLRKTFGLGIIFTIIMSIISFLILLFIGKNIVGFFVTNEQSLKYGSDYVDIMKFMYLLLPINFAFTYGYRTVKKTQISMVINIMKAIVNTVLNLILIFGLLGFPELGVKGAAIATLCSSVFAFILNIIIAIKLKPKFIGKFSEMFSLDKEFVKPVVKKAIPIVLSEAAFGSGQFALSKNYSLISHNAFTSEKISANINSVVNSFTMACANTCGILTGQALGRGNMDEVKDTTKKLLKFVLVIVSILVLISLFVVPQMVTLYDTGNEEIKLMAMNLVRINGFFLAVRTLSSSLIFMLRSGGDTIVSSLIANLPLLLFSIPFSLFAVVVLKFDALSLKYIVILEKLISLIIAFYRYKSGRWMKNLVKST